MSEIDRRAARVILALCDMDLGDFAECVGYKRGYVSNVLTGQTRPSAAFCRAFGDTVTELVFGERCSGDRMLPVTPLLELVRRRARYVPGKRAFYADNDSVFIHPFILIYKFYCCSYFSATNCNM